MSKYVLDSSALMALLNSEKGSEIVEEILPFSIMSTVNVAEVVAELDKRLNIEQARSKEIIQDMVNQIVPLDLNQALEAGSLRKSTEKFGLSLGDRACIALAISTGAPVYTADKIWAKLELNCEIIIIR